MTKRREEKIQVRKEGQLRLQKQGSWIHWRCGIPAVIQKWCVIPRSWLFDVYCVEMKQPLLLLLSNSTEQPLNHPQRHLHRCRQMSVMAVC